MAELKRGVYATLTDRSPAANKRDQKMNILIVTLCALISITAVAQDVPNTFQPGNPIVASEVNANFDALEAEIAVLKAQVEILQSTNSNTLQQHVGNSSGTAYGNKGIRTMTALCQIDYPDARMCTTEEYVKTTNLAPASPGTYAWVNPTHFVGLSGDNNYMTADIYSGLNSNEGPRGLNCQGWAQTSHSFYGVVVDAVGKFGRSSCSSSNAVACCK